MLKYKLGTLFLLMIGIFSFSFASAQDNEMPLLGKVIYIDPGHPSLDKPNVMNMSCSK